MRFFIACLVSMLVLSSIVATYGDDKKDADKEVNLLVNGSFEEGSDPGEQGWKPLDKGSKDIKGWEVTRGQIDYVSTYLEAADGKRSLDLHGSPGYGGVKQTFKTKKGQKYRLSFSLAGNPVGSVAVKRLGVKVADKEEEFSFNTSCKSTTDMGWANQVLDFTATGVETTLEIYTVMEEDPSCGPALDNVSVVASKE
jgi:choice-of-anchor C domain-containing protein